GPLRLTPRQRPPRLPGTVRRTELLGFSFSLAMGLFILLKKDSTLARPPLLRISMTDLPRDLHGCPNFQRTALTRRDLLKVGALGIAGLHLPALLRAAASGQGGRRARAKSIIFLNQFGGPSHLDTFDLKPDAPDNIRG